MDNTGPTLYIVATPIGNLGDLTPRAIDILQSVAVIAAEDTRHSRRLMDHFSIDTPLVSYHDHSDTQNIGKIERYLQSGESIALISDAGTPLIADPGYRLVANARAQSYSVVPIPGACALVAALSASGLPSDRFCFEGFLPAKTHGREKALDMLRFETRTLIFYEAPHRIKATLSVMAECWPGREVVMAREVTKKFETFLSGSIETVLAMVSSDANQERGEIVLMVKGYQAPLVDSDDLDVGAQHTLRVLLKTLPVKQAAAIASDITGLKKRDLYQWAIAHK